MNTDLWRRACDHFCQVVDLTPEEREPYLRALDPAVARAVETLLVSDANAADFLERPLVPAAVSENLKAAASRDSSMRLGPYRLERELSKSGMSHVFLAHRDDGEFEKQVAVKVIAHEAPSAELVKRFRRERQILAALDHPYIARLLDGGTEEGSPFLVMEYVEGTPIDEYCDERRLSIRERLELFAEVCSAVDYAHERGIIHRDLKPTNILVTAAGTPKLLDFGIAKLLDAGAVLGDGEETLPEARVLTPFYASPEQMAGGAISRATDVYALGVLLFKLLAGRLPYRLAAETPEAVKAAVVSQEAKSLRSAVFGGERWRRGTSGAPGGQAFEEVSAPRASTPGSLYRQLDGELDGIVQMALRKEPERRQATAQDLRRALEGYLERLARRDEAIGLRRRASLFLARNRAAVAVVLVLAVVAVALGASWLRRTQLTKEREHLARQHAQNEQLAASFEDLVRRTETARASGRQLRSSAVLDSGARRAMEMLDQDPAAASELMASIGGIYENLGEAAKARRWRSSAESIQRSLARPASEAGAPSEAVTESVSVGSEGERLAAQGAVEDTALEGTSPGLGISVSGNCSQLSVRVNGATPGGVIALATSTVNRPTIVGSGPCPGVQLDLGAPAMLAVTVADGAGDARVETAVPRDACGGSLLQAVDKTRCEPSPVVELQDVAQEAGGQGRLAQGVPGAAGMARGTRRERQQRRVPADSAILSPQTRRSPG